MGRKVLAGLRKISVDCDFYDNEVLDLLVEKYGEAAGNIWRKLSVKILKRGYYIPLSNITDEGTKKYIQAFLDMGLIDRDIYDKYAVLTSSDLQDIYNNSNKLHRRKARVENFKIKTQADNTVTNSSNELCLFELYAMCSNSTSSYNEYTDTLISIEQEFHNNDELAISSKEISSEVREINDSSNIEQLYITENQSFNNNHQISSSFSSESSEQKKKRKEAKEKNKNSKTTHTYARAHSNTIEGVDKTHEDQNCQVDVRVGVRYLLVDKKWIKAVMKRHNLSEDNVKQCLEHFNYDCVCMGKETHINLKDIKHHFSNWLYWKYFYHDLYSSIKSKREKKPKSISQNSKPVNYALVWSECQTELCKAVGMNVAKETFELLNFNSFVDNKLLLKVPNREVFEHIENQHLGLFKKVLNKHFGNVTLNYLIP